MSDTMKYPWKHHIKPVAEVRVAQDDYAIIESWDGKARYAVSVQSTGEIHFDKLGGEKNES